ncbi:MAG: hypothetical protein IT357_12640 [Gemmatimonadaceae bacterium]|nr:hypothetical protein [Gemmatimonadaceae bacterium]
MRDTSDDAQAVQIDAFRRMSPAERVASAFEASEWLMSVARVRTAPAVDVRAVLKPKDGTCAE